MKKGNVYSNISLSAASQEIASRAKHPFARDCQKMVNYCTELEHQIPDPYSWKFTSTEGLKDELIAVIDTPVEWNQIYWKDIAENLQAFSVIAFKRGVSILGPAVRAINHREILPAAILTRSLLELSAWAIHNTEKFKNTIEAIPQDISSADKLITAEGLQTRLVKLLWGTRLETEVEELKQLSILTAIEKVAKRDPENFLLPAYQYLCEVTHPNIVGNAEFWTYPHDSTKRSFKIEISDSNKASKLNHLHETTLASIGWSAACLRNSMHTSSAAIHTIAVRFLNSGDK